ncbi:hypothetical protein H2204_006792 [Knufia peltigerae]|uniref:Uncharacterized protein n=1 Tax=Knufia peltigerae TaxID=1002370 RepID=A0AA38Y2U6_9EURO|nr:hypothetical protein H2204_006792 [Knufia peltigerae]
MAKQAVTVKLELYNGMPHDFTIAMTSSRYSQECLNSWAMFAKLATTTHPLTSFDLTLGKQAVIWDVSGHNHVEDIAAVSGPERSLDDLVQGMKDTIASWDNPPARS